ncbi:DNA polymerase III subunit delta [Sarcina sp. JB2]|uniref:DNA polymerase III subunit delta n=1 Tax=Candidatus Sarcina troglodytae TaxID=2726954 RepID=A0ACD1BF14_9CLOT|nr:DNA polymerase III subunit delta [Sarcina sp. JB2]QPJ85928.1 DNA polymerase III subunit delta [Sarcina sp. JB2]
MIDLGTLNKNIKEKKESNCYILCGLDEMLMKETIDKLSKNFVDDGLENLNISKFYGDDLSAEKLKDAFETFPFMGEKRVVIIYRIQFLNEKLDNDNKKIYEEIKEYLKNTPKQCVIIGYILLRDKREKISKLKKLMALDKYITIVNIEKLRGAALYNRVYEKFTSKGVKIGRIQLRYFCDMVDNNMDIIEREIDKLLNYTHGREITKDDIEALLPRKGEQDIFDLVEFISVKKVDRAVDLINDLINRGESPIVILSQIREQFQKLYRVKIKISKGYKIEDIKEEFLMVSRVNLPNFVVEKMITQSKKFNEEQLARCIKLCANTEKILKSTNVNAKSELEIMIIKTVM